MCIIITYAAYSKTIGSADANDFVGDDGTAVRGTAFGIADDGHRHFTKWKKKWIDSRICYSIFYLFT